MYTPARLGVGEDRGSWGRQQQQPRETKGESRGRQASREPERAVLRSLDQEGSDLVVGASSSASASSEVFSRSAREGEPPRAWVRSSVVGGLHNK